MHTNMNFDPFLVDKIVNEVKSQGVFDQFRKDSMSDVDTKPAYLNLKQRVESAVKNFLNEQTWTPELNKNQLREKLRKRITEAGFLDVGVERIVDQVVNPKIATVFQPKIEDIVYKYLGIEKPEVTIELSDKSKSFQNGSLTIDVKELMPTDLEAVSPDSSKSIEKLDDTKDEEDIDSDKNEEFESPPFEPLEGRPISPVKKEDSNHSHTSAISGLTSQDSVGENKPSVDNICPDISRGSDLSQVSSNSCLSVETNEAVKMKMEPPNENIDLSEEAQMPKFNENSNSHSAKGEPLYFDITREEIKFEGTDWKPDCTKREDQLEETSLPVKTNYENDNQNDSNNTKANEKNLSEVGAVSISSTSMSIGQEFDIKPQESNETNKEETKNRDEIDSSSPHLQIVEQSTENTFSSQNNGEIGNGTSNQTASQEESITNSSDKSRETLKENGSSQESRSQQPTESKEDNLRNMEESVERNSSTTLNTKEENWEKDNSIEDKISSKSEPLKDNNGIIKPAQEEEKKDQIVAKVSNEIKKSKSDKPSNRSTSDEKKTNKDGKSSSEQKNSRDDKYKHKSSHKKSHKHSRSRDDDHSSAKKNKTRRRSTDSNDGDERRNRQQHSSSEKKHTSSSSSQSHQNHNSSKQNSTHDSSKGTGRNHKTCDTLGVKLKPVILDNIFVNNSESNVEVLIGDTIEIKKINTSTSVNINENSVEENLKYFEITKEEELNIENKCLTLQEAIISLRRNSKSVYLLNCKSNYLSLFENKKLNVTHLSESSESQQNICNYSLNNNLLNNESISLNGDIHEERISNFINKVQKGKREHPESNNYTNSSLLNVRNQTHSHSKIKILSNMKHGEISPQEENHCDNRLNKKLKVDLSEENLSTSSISSSEDNITDYVEKITTEKNEMTKSINLPERKHTNHTNIRASQRYSSEDLYKPRPVLGNRSNRRRALDTNVL